MSKRAVFMSLLIAFIFVMANILTADEISPELFRKPRFSGRAAATFDFSRTQTDIFSEIGCYNNNILLLVTPKTPGKLSYTLIDTRDGSIADAGKHVFGKNRDYNSFDYDQYFSVEMDIPAEGRSIRYKFSGRYVPDDKRSWETVTCTEYFTISNYDNIISIE